MSTQLPFEPVNPRPFLSDCIGQQVTVKLKWGLEYRGILRSYDNYMNVLLAEATEWIEGENRGVLGQLLIRCNNILYVRQDIVSTA